MGLSAHWADYLDIISLKPVKTLPWVNTMGLSVPISNSLDIIDFHTDEIKLIGINQMGLSAPRADSLVIINLQIVKTIVRY